MTTQVKPEGSPACEESGQMIQYFRRYDTSCPRSGQLCPEPSIFAREAVIEWRHQIPDGDRDRRFLRRVSSV